MCSANTRGQGHVGLFYETTRSKGPTTHWWTQRRLGSRDIVYGSTDILGLFLHDTRFIPLSTLRFICHSCLRSTLVQPVQAMPFRLIQSCWLTFRNIWENEFSSRRPRPRGSNLKNVVIILQMSAQLFEIPVRVANVINVTIN